MATKTAQTAEFGDFQTPQDLAGEVCTLLARRGVRPQSILEPTCGRGSFLSAAADAFPTAESLTGIEINGTHLQAARRRMRGTAAGGRTQLRHCDIFELDWQPLLSRMADPFLVVGNPPWVTNAELASLGSANLPEKSNIHGDRGIEAITGRGNFDISEWLLLKILSAVQGRRGTLAMLCKTSVARRVLRFAWERSLSFAAADLFRIDAVQHFGAAVDAGLLIIDFSPAATVNECRIFSAIDAERPTTAIGWRDDSLVADVAAYDRCRHLYGDGPYQWRSGIKHDCARVMEFRKTDGGYQNGLGELVDLERRFLFPMLKSSDLARAVVDQPSRVLLVPQRRVGEETDRIRQLAPKTWRYLQQHADRLKRRASSIYKNRPPFSVFGVGPYSFSQWKVAISGFYKQLTFNAVGPFGNKPVVFDDTCNFVPCESEAEATLFAELLNSELGQDALSAYVFWDTKRPVTIELLRRVDLRLIANELGLIVRSTGFSRNSA